MFCELRYLDINNTVHLNKRSGLYNYYVTSNEEKNINLLYINGYVN
jgi:hypothetical protein